MWIIARPRIRAFGARHADAKQALYAWHAEVERAAWTGPQDIKSDYPSASILGDDPSGNRVVFNIKGNKYRVFVAVKYASHRVYIRFVGTHAEYDKIDARTV